MSGWFEVSKEGLRQLQAGKPKTFIARELVQNAFDENVKVVRFVANYLPNQEAGEIIIEDDSPEGFKDLSHAFTLFAPTYKRADPEKRGRFNLGEKQVLSIAERAAISTIKGTVVFDDEGRHEKNDIRRESGSTVTVIVKMTRQELAEIIEEAKTFLVPDKVLFTVNGEDVPYRVPHRIMRAQLPTEVEKDGVFRPTARMTSIYVYKPDQRPISKPARLYEMGLPVTEIDSEFDINVGQKVPLSADRDTVPVSFLKKLYGEVANAVVDEIPPEGSSKSWVRTAMESDRISPETVKEIVQKRYGDKVVVANNFDKNSIDRAIVNGYKVIFGNEMSGEEWANVKGAEAIKSSSDLFGSGDMTNAKKVEPTEEMEKVADLARRIANKHWKDIDIEVRFLSWTSNIRAEYGNKTLTFNVKNLGERFFVNVVDAEILSLIIHELAHEEGNHTEHGYQDAVTKLGALLIILALNEPEFFGVKILGMHVKSGGVS